MGILGGNDQVHQNRTQSQCPLQAVVLPGGHTVVHFWQVRATSVRDAPIAFIGNRGSRQGLSH